MKIYLDTSEEIHYALTVLCDLVGDLVNKHLADEEKEELITRYPTFVHLLEK